MLKLPYPDAVLCYVEDYRAYFTTLPLAEQWGDDWNDVPYEHNAGTPYTHWGDRKPEYHVLTVCFDAELVTPCDGHMNSPYSVEDINSGDVAWLRRDPYSSKEKLNIMAGTRLEDFIRIIAEDGGTVYVPFQWSQP